MTPRPLPEEQQDFYRKLRTRIRGWLEREGADHAWADLLLFAPDLFHLLCRLAADPEVPAREKAKLAAAIAYFISPLDLVPEAILGPAGFVDDVALAAYVLDNLLNRTDPEVVRRHWAGEEDVLEVVRRIVGTADRMVGSGIWKKLRGKIR